MTVGLLVLVQLVMAAMTTSPWARAMALPLARRRGMGGSPPGFLKASTRAVAEIRGFDGGKLDAILRSARAGDAWLHGGEVKLQGLAESGMGMSFWRQRPCSLQ
jgi:hypothetical protein